ncbi:hypothetical protein K1X12_02010 [Hyphomonas sp. WL0036]|uniref:hypothetical protein n=1 Tax=Hyphomonas sediminis TaxID=2866160 RepID=UPI001C823A33|nr:hypothetical protein [Hyphomonas sediminis]MBY9065654.1 hypothetical protein [Hyphomonas sediminis]
MRAIFADSSNSLIRFAQVAAEYLALGLATRLGLGRFGHTAFLPKADYRAIAAELGFIELLVRRALFLIAAVRGILPAPPAKPSSAKPSSAKPGPAAKPAGPPRAPRFGLTERAKPARRLPGAFPLYTAPRHPAQAEWAGAGARAGGLLPAARLVRRLQALEAVFDGPEAYILRMQRLLSSGPRKILARAAVPATPLPGVDPQDYRILLKLQLIVGEGIAQLWPDTG